MESNRLKWKQANWNEIKQNKMESNRLKWNQTNSKRIRLIFRCTLRPRPERVDNTAVEKRVMNSFLIIIYSPPQDPEH